MTGYGPPPGACGCWHTRDRHDGPCTVVGCGCPAFTWSVFALLTLAVAALRRRRQQVSR